MAYNGSECLVRAVMSGFSGLPEDEVVNTFAFSGVVTSTDIDDAFTAVDSFFNGINATGQSVGGWISSYVPRNVTHRMEAYRIQDHPTDPAKSMLGSPIGIEAWLGPNAALAATGLPSEVAAVLSIHSELFGQQEEVGSTRPKARRRGRIYLGPLITDAIVEVTPPYMLAPNVNTNLRQAAVRLMDNVDAEWCVWSRKDKLLRNVVGGWTDDAPDTQRRRGPDRTSRVLFGDLDV